MSYNWRLICSFSFVSFLIVCTSHFVVMFIGSEGLGINKRLCNAYISQSSRGLRSLLKEHVRCPSVASFLIFLIRNYKCYIIIVKICEGAITVVLLTADKK